MLAGSTKLNTRSSDAFHVARVRSVVGELDVCVPVTNQPETPVPGNVVAGLVYLVASIDELWTGVDALHQPTPRKRRWFRRGTGGGPWHDRVASGPWRARPAWAAG